MRVIIKFLMIVVLLISCDNQKRNTLNKEKGSGIEEDLPVEVVEFPKDESQENLVKLSNKIDSLTITCFMFDRGGDKSFVVKSNNIKSEWINIHNEEDRGNISQEKINHLWNFVELFYIDKTEKIILSTREEPAPVTDYPVIIFEGYKDGEKMFEQHTTLSIDKNFNPKFLEFYNFLESLIEK